MNSENRPVAIVTGSSSGIGRATALELAEHGWNLVVHGLDEAHTRAVATEVEATGAQTVTVTGDTRGHETAGALADAAVGHFGRIDGVVNNAGTGLSKRFDELDEDDWESLVQMHLLHTTRLLREARPHLVASRGAVVNISSLAATRGLGLRTGYGTVKTAVEGLTVQLGCEWAPLGIRVNAVAPGTILTPLVRRNFERGLLDEERVLERTPLGRLGEPGEIATVVRFLLSTDASYMTGQTLRVDGGWSVWGGWS